MPQFSQNSSVALTWSPGGECHGIRVKRVGDGCRIVAHWTERADKTRSVGELLAVGAKVLNARDASYFGACSTGDGWGTADIQMPSLPSDQLRNGLAFELQKHTPIGLDRLTWGYRRIVKGTSTTKAVYRVVYVRNDVWKAWCGIAAALAPLDAIVPAPATLDPLFEGQSVVFAVGDGQGDAYVPGPTGRIVKRVVLPSVEEPSVEEPSVEEPSVEEPAVEEPAVEEPSVEEPVVEEPVDAGDENGRDDSGGESSVATAFPQVDWLDLGELGHLSLDEQQSFVSALVLAVYGLTVDASKDSQTVLPLPVSLRPHRSVFLVISACVLLGVAVAAIVLNGVLRLQANYSQASQLRREIAAVEKEITVKRAFIKNDRLKKLQELQEELKGELPDYPPFPLALNDLSIIIDGDRECKPWISSKLTWSHDTNTMKFSVEEPVGGDAQKPLIEQVELIDALNDSPYILDAKPNSSTYNKTENKTVREFTIQLGWPEASVRAEAAKRNQERAKERRERARKAEAAAKAAAKAAADQSGEAADEDAPSTGVPSEDAAGGVSRGRGLENGQDGGKSSVSEGEGAAPMTPPLPPGLPPVPSQP